MAYLLDLKPSQCRYPHGDGTPYDFCGDPVTRGSYCAEHAAVCFDKKTPKHWTGILGMIHASEGSVIYTGVGGDKYLRRETVSPIDEVFANSRIGEKPLLERVL